MQSLGCEMIDSLNVFHEMLMMIRPAALMGLALLLVPAAAVRGDEFF
jgi:hypothetical protein